MCAMRENNGTEPRQFIQIGEYYLTKDGVTESMVWIENAAREGMEIPEVIFERLIKNFWEVNF